SYGHALGLHFDPTYYGSSLSIPKLTGWLSWERTVLEKWFEAPVRFLSWHNPTLTAGNWHNEDILAGMINVYGDSIQKNYKYCSDSNGYWRHDRLGDILNSRLHPKIHVLTHDVWWTPSVMSPHDRIIRCVQGRADATLKGYNRILGHSQRNNI